MNITYIFKYSLPGKAKEKENKLFAKDTAGGIVLGMQITVLHSILWRW